MHGVSILFFGAACKALSRQHGERMVGEPANAMLAALAEAERLYCLLPKCPPKEKKPRETRKVKDA